MKPPRHALPGGFLERVLYVKADARATPEGLRRSVRNSWRRLEVG